MKLMILMVMKKLYSQPPTSAVNELTIANAATGNAPEIAATGDDTDIDLKLTPKGAGNLVLDGIEFPNADGSANQALVTNGSGVLSFAGAGKVLQVVSTTYATQESTSSNTYQTSNLAVSITPSSASNKVLIIVSGTQATSGAATECIVSLFRDSTNLGSANNGISQAYSGAGLVIAGMSVSILDTPNTTSSITYAVKWKAFSGAHAQELQPNNSTSSIVALEIAG
jgi:hypothetical protein